MLQKLIPQKPNLRPGVFSQHSVFAKQSDSFVNNNSTQDTTLKTNANLTQSVDTNNQTKKTPFKRETNLKYNSEININKERPKTKQNSQPKNLLEQFKMFQNNQKNDLLYQLLEQNIKTSIEKKQLNNVVVTAPSISMKENENTKRRTSSSPSGNIQNQQYSKSKQKMQQSKKTLPKTNENIKKQLPKGEIDPYLLQKQSPGHQQVPGQKSGGKKLNFNVQTPGKKESDNVFLDTTNQMANMIIENILNKDDYYERVKKENVEMKEQSQQYVRQLNELKMRLQLSESQAGEFKFNLEQERNRYQSELLKIQEKLSVTKNLQSIFIIHLLFYSLFKDTLQNERIKNEQNQKLTLEAQKQNQHYKGLISSAALASIDYLSNFRSLFSNSQSEVEMIILQLLKMSVSIVLEIIQKAQALKLPALSHCHIPESLDLEEFFTQLEQVFAGRKQSVQNSPSNSSELSFRQKSNIQQNSLPLSQVQYKQPSHSMSLQEQFNTFLAMQDDDLEDIDVNLQQLGSPYFTHTLNVELQENNQLSSNANNLNLPRQMKETNNAQMLILQQNRFQTEVSDSNRTLASDNEKLKQIQDKKHSQSQPFQLQQTTQQVVSDKLIHPQHQISQASQNNQNLQNFQSFNKNSIIPIKQQEVDHLSVVPHLQDTSDNDTNIYDSLFSEMNKASKRSTPQKKSNSLHTLKYLDEQIDRSRKQSDKENQNRKQEKNSIKEILANDHCLNLFAIAKFDYLAQKVKFSFNFYGFVGK